MNGGVLTGIWVNFKALLIVQSMHLANGVGPNIFVMDFCSLWKRGGWNVVPRLCNAPMLLHAFFWMWGKSGKPHATVRAANQDFMTATRFSVVRNQAPALLNQTPIIIWPSWLKTAQVSDVQSTDDKFLPKRARTCQLFLCSICALYMFVSGLISCCFFQVFHILLFFNQCLDSAGRKLYFRKCLSKILPWTTANHVRKGKRGLPVFGRFPNSITVESFPKWEVWSSVFYFLFLWLSSCWWMWQKYTAVTVHDSTPQHKSFVGMSCKWNWSFIWSAKQVTEPSLRCWVMMSCLANHHGDSKNGK